MSAAPVMSITDELIAELESVASDDFPLSAIDTETLRALLAERAELKRDAERYAWLNDSPKSFGILRAMSTADLTGQMVDQAIDAAMIECRHDKQVCIDERRAKFKEEMHSDAFGDDK